MIFIGVEMTKKEEEIEDTSREIFGEEIVPTEKVFGKEDEMDIDLPVVGINPESEEVEQSVDAAKGSIEDQRKINDSSPELSSEDFDADWQDSQVTGSETSLADNPTPDQDIVDNVSKPWGTNYEEEDELNIAKKLRRLERERSKDEIEGMERK
jgi:hypothetical protein